MGTASDKTDFKSLKVRPKTAFGGNAGGDMAAKEAAAAEMENKEPEAVLENGDEEEIEAKATAIANKTNQKEIRGKAERKKWWRFVQNLLIQQATEKALARIQEIIAFHQAQMETLAENLRLSRVGLEHLNERHEALIKELRRFRETGRFDLDKAGRFKDGKAEEALIAWEEKTGKSLDLRDTSSYLDVMEAAADLETQEAEIRENMDRDERDYEYHKTKRDEALEIKNDLESGDPGRCENALKLLENLDGNQKAIRVEKSLMSETKIASSLKQGLLQEVGLTEADLALESFSFNFPPLQASFTEAAAKVEEATKRAGMELQKQEQKATSISPVMK